MQVPGSVPFWSTPFQGALRIKATSGPLAVPAVSSSTAKPSQFAREVQDLSKALKSLKISSGFRKVTLNGASQLAQPGSALGDDLGLLLQSTSAILRSKEEVNAIPTSFGPFQPDMVGPSTAQPTIGGIYNGSSGDDTLTFEVTNGGIVGVDELHLLVTDGNGTEIDTLKFTDSYKAGEQISVNNKLNVALSDGLLLLGDSFELSVFSSVGSAVDPTKAFNGTGDDIPNFEPGEGVSAGSFVVNGYQILVEATDSILSVLDKISASDAGVLATFDSAAERVVLTHKTPGSDGEIKIEHDSTGFRDAVKLSGAGLEDGEDSELDMIIHDVSSLQIETGTFKINGTEIGVDKHLDSLADVIQRINEADLGVTASMDVASGALQISSSGMFELEDGDSEFFLATGIEDGTYGVEAVEEGGLHTKLQFKNTRGLRRGLREVGKAVQNLLESPVLAGKTLESGLVRSALHDALREAFSELSSQADGGGLLRTGLGINLEFGQEGEALLKIDQNRLSKSFGKKAGAVVDFLRGDAGGGGGQGLVSLLSNAVERIEQSVYPLLDPSGKGGLFLDKTA